MFESCGRITTATPNVKAENLAELVAFTRALQWSRQYALAQGRPICIRYSSEYAMRIATGAWKAKKHKAMADEAKKAWASLKRSNGGQLWARHVKASLQPAPPLAQRGKGGATLYDAVVD